MSYLTFHSPLATDPGSWYPQRMDSEQAQTLHPSLRGRCGGRPVCQFTAADIRRQSQPQPGRSR